MQTAEFSRPIDVSSLDDGASNHRTIVASPDECRALAHRFGAASLESLEADVVLRRHGRQVRACFRYSATVVQSCVITLEPVRSAIKESFTMIFDPDVRATGEFDEPLGIDDDDPPEALRNETLDAGKAVAEMFGLVLDPWPRKPGAEVDSRYTTREALKVSPFAGLEILKSDD